MKTRFVLFAPFCSLLSTFLSLFSLLSPLFSLSLFLSFSSRFPPSFSLIPSFTFSVRRHSLTHLSPHSSIASSTQKTLSFIDSHCPGGLPLQLIGETSSRSSPSPLRQCSTNTCPHSRLPNSSSNRHPRPKPGSNNNSSSNNREDLLLRTICPTVED